MPYIGRGLDRGNYLKLDDISSSFNGSLTTFNLTAGNQAFFPGSAFSILVVLAGVVQEPEAAYNINQSQITFASAPLAGDQFFCISLGVPLGVNTPANGTVNGAQLAKPFNYDGYFYLDDANNRVGVGTATPQKSLHVVGEGQFDSVRVLGDLTIDGTTTTLDTVVTEVDKLEVGANNSTVGVAITQSGSGDILNLYDGATEVFSVADGGDVSIVDKIIHTGDTNTAIRFPADDTVAVETAGTERLRITSTGRVGIGTDNPGQELEVFSDDFTGIRIKSSRTGLTEQIGSVGFSTSLDVVATINALVDGTVVFKNTTSDTERLRITSAGRVGIGTNSPQSQFEVFGSSPVVRSKNTTNQTYTEISNDGTDGYLDWSSGDLIFRSASNTERLRITAAGNIGIGTAVPQDELDVHGNIITGGLKLVNNDRGNPTRKIVVGSSSVYHIRLYDPSDTTKLQSVFKMDGTVGIGTDNPSAKLEVSGDARVTGILTVGQSSVTIDGTNSRIITPKLDYSAISSSISDTAVDIFVYDTTKDSDGGAWRKRTQNTSWYNETLNTSTRGSRKEFPAVAVIVAESAKVTIYDGDDPDLPMWMVLTKGSSGTMMYSTSTGVFTSITAVNGNIYYGMTSTAGAGKIEFINDSSFKYRPSPRSNRGSFKGSIADRDLSLSWNLEATVLVDEDINDVAVTVLQNAPIDPYTGLPVPTIAVATGDGVSVIEDDGTVVDYTYQVSSNKNADHVYLSKSGRLQYSSRSTNAGQIYYVEYDQLSSSNISSAPNVVLSVSETGGSEITRILPRGHIQSSAVTDEFTASGISPGTYTNYQGGLFLHKTTGDVRETDGFSLPNGNFMGVHIRPDYNTGWMSGNIKGAFLSDTTVESLTANTNLATSATANGYNRLTSETYDNGDTSWQMVDNAGSSNGYVKIELTNLVVGQTYVISMTWDNNATLDGGYTHKIQHQDGTASENFTEFLHWNKTNGSAETLTGLFTAQTTNNENLVMYCNAITLNVSNFNVRAVDDEDRSVNNNGLQVFGTVTKSAVATGAELVAYSGFSTSNYLQQPYNSDLDFGTGDFSIILWIKNSSSEHDYALSIGVEGSTTNPRLGIRGSANHTIAFNQNGGVDAGDGIDSGQYTTGNWQQVTITRSGGLVSLYIDSILKGTSSNIVDYSFSKNNAGILLGHWPTNKSYAFGGSLALLRISASAPTAEQIKKIYDDERWLFQENAKCTLYGSSDAVTALAYDDTTELLHVGTSAGRSDFRGLRRINNTTTAVTTAISAQDDLIAEQ